MNNTPEFNKKRIEDLKKKLLSNPLAKSLLDYMSSSYYSGKERGSFMLELDKICGGDCRQLESIDAFYNESLRRAVAEITDKDYAEKIKELMELSCRGQFSSTIFRRSYASSEFQYHAEKILNAIRSWMNFYFYETSVEDMLLCKTDMVHRFDDFVALEINAGNVKVMDILREMILGDNNVLISADAIGGIIKSDNWEVKELLKNLLLAAKGQEGLRQSILHQVDSGDLQTFKYFLECCVENDMFRFSAAARSLYVWTGLSSEEPDINLTRKMGRTALECLKDKEKRAAYYESDNPIEIYLSIWARGCENIADTKSVLDDLLKSDKPYKRILGWYFIYHIENGRFRHNMALEHLEEALETEDMRIYGQITDCLHIARNTDYMYLNMQNRYAAEPNPDNIYPESPEERRAIFERLVPLVKKVGKKTWSFPGYLFPWSDMVVNIDNANVIPCMMSLAIYDLDEYMIGELYGLMEYMNVERRMAFYARFLSPETNAKHREYVLEGLKDKSASVKNICIHKLMQCNPEDEDIEAICSMFSSRSGDLRKLLVKYLTNLNTDNKLKAAELLLSGGDNHIQAAAELVLKDENLAEFKTVLFSRTEGKKLSDQTRLILDQLFPKEAAPEISEEISPENGYGLFDPKLINRTIEEFSQAGGLGKMSEEDILAMLPGASVQEKLFEALNAVLEAHKDYEYSYINYADEKLTVLLGDSGGPFAEIYVPAEYGKHSDLSMRNEIRLDMIPFGEEFKAAFGDTLKDKKTLAALEFMYRNSAYTYKGDDYLEWIQPFMEKFCVGFDAGLSRKYGNRIAKFRFLIDIAYDSVMDDEMAEIVLDMYLSLLNILGPENYEKPSKLPRGFDPDPLSGAGVLPLTSLRHMFSIIPMGDEMFKLVFKRVYVFERNTNFSIGSILDFHKFIRAIDLGIITQEHLCDFILCPGKINRYGNLMIMTTLNRGYGQTYAEMYPWYAPLAEKITRSIVLFESRRGQADTPVSRLIREIGKYKGANYFVLLLKALGTEDFFRGYQWFSTTKQGNLSILLKRCYPAETDTPETLKALLADTDIKENRLIEAAMYAPQWAPFIEDITGWTGLKKAVWFFHAHVSEEFSSDKETEVALYSPISSKQFNDGLFDADWFRESYSQLGEKRFKFLHKFAKYITSGSNNHRRSQLFADAATGKLDETALEKEIREKRNQERIRAYAVIPLREGDTAQLLHRYEFISSYIKESKLFGAQRKEAERKAGAAALENLAVTCGIYDVNRMLWKLEKAKNQEILPLFEKKEIEGYILQLALDSDANASILCEKDGKTLKSLPKALAKNDYAELLKQKIRELKDQKARGRETLEKAMISETEFGAAEIADLMGSLAIAPVAAKLLWTDGINIGFPEASGEELVLKSLSGTVNLDADCRLKVAHPYHLKTSGCWADYMHLLYEQGIIQPFKQVFREYYPITEEEKDENTVSRRYAGYQVQPAKTAALLKARGWTVDYENGWQKVNYSRNTVVRLYSYADWFTAADIEAPTLEEIKFYDRKADEPIQLSSIDPVSYSEIMRDLDLVVSVAYVGGVDAETSHSTLEMRRAIAKELCGLLKLSNVEFLEKHAKVYGKLAEYSVHLGSGVVHASGKGVVNILPVHSQHRGRIFLPFADEDPKTAEIMSKIILLAEDEKIKDPTILQQL